MKNINWKNKIPLILALIVAAVFPALPLKPYYLHIAIISLIYVLLTTGLNVVVGYIGQLSLAQAAFYAIGAYTSALLSTKLNVPFYLTFPISTITAAFFGFLLGAPTLRLKGPYFVIASIGFNEVVRLIFLNWKSLANGPDGINGVPTPTPIRLGSWVIDFSEKIHFYYFYLIIVILVVIVTRNILNSRTGRAFKSIREDMIASEVMGVNQAFYKIFALCYDAALSGMAGCMFVHYIGFVGNESFTTAESINILIMTVIGGKGTIAGPIIGAVVINYLLETLRFLQQYRLIIYGAVLFLVILFMPSGLMGLIQLIKEKLTEYKKKPQVKGGESSAS